MPTNITNTINQVLALNNPEKNPFIFESSGNQIIGRWDITNSRWFWIDSVTDIQKNYKIIVNLDESTGKYTTQETKKDIFSRLIFAFSPIPGHSELTFNSKTDMFIGKMAQKSISIGIGGEKNGSNGIGINSFKFNTSQIKKPLFDTLNNLGWKKKGFFG